MGMALAGTKDLTLVITNANGKQTRVSAETLIRDRRFVNQDIDMRASIDNTLFRDEPLNCKQGKFTLPLFATDGSAKSCYKLNGSIPDLEAVTSWTRRLAHAATTASLYWSFMAASNPGMN